MVLRLQIFPASWERKMIENDNADMVNSCRNDKTKKGDKRKSTDIA